MGKPQPPAEIDELFRTMADAAPVLISVSGPDALCVFVNHAWLSFTGRTFARELGDGWTESVHPDDLKRCLDLYRSSFGICKGFQAEWRLRRRDGVYRWVSHTGTPWFRPDGALAGFVGFCVDITDQRQVREDREAFLSMLSHDLRTPLNTIVGWTHILRTGPHEPVTMKRAGEIIERNVRFQAQQVDDALDLSRLLAGTLGIEVQSVALGSVIETAIGNARASAEARGIRLQTDIDRSVPAVRGDRHRLEQAVGNLLSNAIESTPKRGRVDIGLARGEAGARIRVAHTGAGMHPDEAGRLFGTAGLTQRSASAARGKSRLGLALARLLVELHGGHVTAEGSGREAGAAITVEIPFA